VPFDGSNYVLTPAMKYLVFQLEVGAEGTPHYQGFAVYQNPASQSSVQSFFQGARVSPQGYEWEEREGKWVKLRGATPSKARAYCMKEDTRVAGPWELGVWAEPAQGKRTDLKDFMEDVKLGKRAHDLIEDHPEVAAKYPGFFSLYCNKHRKVEPMENVEVRPWQQWTLDLIKTNPDDRSVYWFYDEKGGSGKTFLTKYISYLYPNEMFLCNGGKAADICFAYNGEKVVIFNYARDHADYVGYGPIEQLKDGIFFSSKYQSMMKRFDPPHVLIFANFLLDRSKISKDRVHVVTFEENQITYLPPFSLIKQVLQ